MASDGRGVSSALTSKGSARALLQGCDLLAQAGNAPGHGVAMHDALAAGPGQRSDDDPQLGLGGRHVFSCDGLTRFPNLGAHP